MESKSEATKNFNSHKNLKMVAMNTVSIIGGEPHPNSSLLLRTHTHTHTHMFMKNES